MPSEDIASRRAKEWIDDMIRKHGRHYTDRIVIPLSQREIARQEGLSPGTIAWYLDQLADDIVDRRPFIVIRRCTRTRSPVIAAEAVEVDAASTIAAAMAELTDAIEAQCALLRLVLDELRPRDSATGRASESRDRATEPRGDSRGLQVVDQEEQRDRDLLTHSSSPVAREWPARDSRGPARLVELLGPLDDLVRRGNLVPVTNRQRLAAALAPYSDDEIAAGIGRVRRLVRSGVTVRSPYGLLITKAEAGDDEFFQPDDASARADAEGVVVEPPASPAAEAEVAVMEADPNRWANELAKIDHLAFERLTTTLPDRAARLFELPGFRHDARVSVVTDRLERTR